MRPSCRWYANLVLLKQNQSGNIWRLILSLRSQPPKGIPSPKILLHLYLWLGAQVGLAICG